MLITRKVVGTNPASATKTVADLVKRVDFAFARPFLSEPIIGGAAQTSNALLNGISEV